MTISLIVPAAGCGARAGLGANKILAPILGRPLLWHTLRALQTPDYAPLQVEELLVAARANEFAAVCEAADDIWIRIVEGGATRQESVFAAVKAARGDYVLVHDAARPCVEAEQITQVCFAAIRAGAAILAVPVSDTVKRVQESPRIGGGLLVQETLPRQTVYLAQTPQVFKRELLLRALETAQRDNFAGTDCASLVERLGEPVAIVPGSARNFKVTYADDLARAEAILRKT